MILLAVLPMPALLLVAAAALPRLATRHRLRRQRARLLERIAAVEAEGLRHRRVAFIARTYVWP